ncbi:MAG TPA: Hsp20/alpha crystallin family protein [Anaerolineales bacterium]|nr:Hsp20/alpha crystallin family protein [Anaerolineales bacterium]
MSYFSVTPYRKIASLSNLMDRVFDDVITRTNLPWAEALGLAIDVHQTEDAYVVTADLPGWTADQIKIEVLDNVVSIRGEKVEEKSEEKAGYLLKERRSGNFSRSFSLPKAIDSSKVQAELQNGVLSLNLPLAEEVKPKAVSVNVK